MKKTKQNKRRGDFKLPDRGWDWVEKSWRVLGRARVVEEPKGKIVE